MSDAASIKTKGRLDSIFDSPSQNIAGVSPDQIRPIYDRILVRDIPTNDVSAGGIELTAAPSLQGLGKSGRMRIAEVVAVGDGDRFYEWIENGKVRRAAYPDGQYPPLVRPGDRVVVDRRREGEIYLDGERYTICHEYQAVFGRMKSFKLRPKATGWFVDGANQDGTVIHLRGGGELLGVSDGISFAGVQSVNPRTKRPSGMPLIVAVASFGTNRVTIAPGLITSGPYQNASNCPQSGSEVFRGLESVPVNRDDKFPDDLCGLCLHPREDHEGPCVQTWTTSDGGGSELCPLECSSFVESERSEEFEPLYDWVVVEPIATSEQEGSIHIPESARKSTREGIVRAVGCGRRGRNGELIPTDVAPGDRVLFAPLGAHQAEEILLFGEKLLIMREKQILVVVGP